MQLTRPASRTSRALAGTLLAVLAVHASTAAHADVLPPPESCPSGQVWVTGHSGGCREEAPTNCPPGWRGAVGGLCVVAIADADGACRDGAVAKPATLCFEKRTLTTNGRLLYDPPREIEVPVGIVGTGTAGAACTGPSRHESSGQICLAAGETAFPFVNAGTDARGPRTPEAPHAGCARGCGAGEDAGDLGAVAVALLWIARPVRRVRQVQ